MEQKPPDNSDVHRSLQDWGFFILNLLHITLLACWTWRWLLHFWKICGPLLRVLSHIFGECVVNSVTC